MVEHVLGIRLAAAQLVAYPVEVVGEAPEVDRSLYLSHSQLLQWLARVSAGQCAGMGADQLYTTLWRQQRLRLGGGLGSLGRGRRPRQCAAPRVRQTVVLRRLQHQQGSLRARCLQDGRHAGRAPGLHDLQQLRGTCTCPNKTLHCSI